jgi:hypothetical protein
VDWCCASHRVDCRDHTDNNSHDGCMIPLQVFKFTDDHGVSHALVQNYRYNPPPISVGKSQLSALDARLNSGSPAPHWLSRLLAVRTPAVGAKIGFQRLFPDRLLKLVAAAGTVALKYQQRGGAAVLGSVVSAADTLVSLMVVNDQDSLMIQYFLSILTGSRCASRHWLSLWL